MCITRSWKSLNVREHKNTLYISATRSDGLLINLVNNLVPMETNIAKQFKSVFDLLETYRNCKCKQGEFCERHFVKDIVTQEHKFGGIKTHYKET